MRINHYNYNSINNLFYALYILLLSFLITSIVYVPFSGAFVRFYPAILNSFSIDLLAYDPYILSLKNGIPPEFFLLFHLFSFFSDMISSLEFNYYLGFLGLLTTFFILCIIVRCIGKSFVLPIICLIFILLQRYIGLLFLKTKYGYYSVYHFKDIYEKKILNLSKEDWSYFDKTVKLCQKDLIQLNTQERFLKLKARLL